MIYEAHYIYLLLFLWISSTGHGNVTGFVSHLLVDVCSSFSGYIFTEYVYKYLPQGFKQWIYCIYFCLTEIIHVELINFINFFFDENLWKTVSRHQNKWFSVIWWSCQIYHDHVKISPWTRVWTDVATRGPKRYIKMAKMCPKIANVSNFWTRFCHF